MVDANEGTPSKTFFLTTFICFSGCLNCYIDTAVSAVNMQVNSLVHVLKG